MPVLKNQEIILWIDVVKYYETTKKVSILPRIPIIDETEISNWNITYTTNRIKEDKHTILQTVLEDIRHWNLEIEINEFVFTATPQLIDIEQLKGQDTTTEELISKICEKKLFCISDFYGHPCLKKLTPQKLIQDYTQKDKRYAYIEFA